MVVVGLDFTHINSQKDPSITSDLLITMNENSINFRLLWQLHYFMQLPVSEHFIL